MSFLSGDPCPDIDLSRDEKWRLQTSQYGDGYQQRTLDGINALDLSWTVSYSNREKSVLAPLLDELRAAKSGPISFKDPADGKVYLVTADEWSIQWVVAKRASGLLYGTLSVTFQKFNGQWLQGGSA